MFHFESPAFLILLQQLLRWHVLLKMPRYYFNNDQLDEKGTELPDDAAARDAACETFGEEIRDMKLSAPGKSLKFRVVDKSGRVVASLTFVATVDV